MRLSLLHGAAVTALILGACGDDSDNDTDDDVGTEPVAETDFVQVVSSDFGDILADSEGFTLYGFTQDSDGESNCYDECAALWPPLTVDDELPEGLDPDVYSLTERDDGEQQLVAGDWPLYLYAQDEVAGDLNGQDVGGVWFAVAPDGQLVEDAAVADDDSDDGGY